MPDAFSTDVLSNYLGGILVKLTSPVVKAAIKKFKSSQGPQGSRGIDIEREFESLGKELRSMQCSLRDVEQKNMPMGESLANWAKQVKDTAWQVEDMMEKIVYCNLGQDWDKSWSSKAAAYMNDLLPKIKKEFESEIPERKKRYLLDHEAQRSNVSDHRVWRPDVELPHDTKGRDEIEVRMQDEAKNTVIGWLIMETDNAPKNMVTTICGMGGLGKTTLARKVYNSERVKSHFDCSAWVHISQSYNTDELLRRIIRQLCEPNQAIPDNRDQSGRAALLGLLHQCLHQKRYLIVLDDVWSRNACNDFSYLLQNGEAGSRVIVTTRDHQIASSLSIESHILNFQPLPESEAWSLFCKKVFWINGDSSCPPDLEDWARKIMAKCEGLPLAVVTLGIFMSSQDYRRAITWRHFYSSLSSELSNNEMLVNMSRSLMLSLDDLPYPLKQCFVYCCSVFPPNYLIRKNWLVRLWVAEGFVEKISGLTTQEVAEEYLDQLIRRSMLQVAKRDESGRVKACRVHVLVSEISLPAAKAEKFCTVSDEQGTDIDGSARHLSIQSKIEKAPADAPKNNKKKGKVKNDKKKEKAPFGRDDLSCLRSLLYFVDDNTSAASFLTMLPNLVLLKVLELRGVPIDRVPVEVFNLFNLRYLSLRDTKMKKLPKYVERLQMLETLDLRGTEVVYLPHEITTLKKLRHLLMDRVYVLERIKRMRTVMNSLLDQADIKKIDEKLDQIVSVIGTGTHSWIWDMKGLLSLKMVESNERIIADLAELVQLRRLGIEKVQEDDGCQLCNSLSKMKQLLSLTITAASGNALRLDSLTSPPRYLRKLVLEGQLLSVPPWFNLLSSLTHLYLLDCQMEATCDPLPLLGNLEHLVHLTLRRAYHGNQLCFRGEQFLHLKSLNIAELDRLNQLCVEEDALPRLCVLHLSRCGDLQAEGVECIVNLPALRHIYMQDMPEGLMLGDPRLKRSNGWEFISESLSWL